jgi:hypothetical protein
VNRLLFIGASVRTQEANLWAKAVQTLKRLGYGIFVDVTLNVDIESIATETIADWS